MFPKQNCFVKITDERLLRPERGTIKKSINGHNYNLIKKNSNIQINVLPPVTFKEMVLGFLEVNIDLKAKKEEFFEVKIGLKSLIKYIYIFFAIQFPIFFVLIAVKNLIGALAILCLFSTIMYFQYRQFLGGMDLFAERLKADKAIFL